MLSIGLDVHLNSTAVCVLDANGRLLHERDIRGEFHAVVKYLGSFKDPFRVAFEASCGYGTVHDLLAPIASEVLVAHPTELKLRFNSKHKNDRVDAKKIAKLLYMEELPRVHVPCIDVRSWRGLIEHRMRLVERRTMMKNSLRALFRGLLIKCPARRTMWSKKGLEWARTQPLQQADKFRADALVEQIELLSKQIAQAEKELDKIGDADTRVQLLRTIPGVGPRTAEAVAAYIDKPERFTHNRAIGKYFGIVPSQDQSGPKNRLGHITREGPATVRQLITQAAWQAVRRSPGMKAWYQRVKHGQKSRTATALVAAGHKLLRIMLAMLQSGKSWSEERLAPADTAVPAAASTDSTATTHAALPPSATDKCIEAQRPVRRGRGKGSSVKKS